MGPTTLVPAPGRQNICKSGALFYYCQQRIAGPALTCSQAARRFKGLLYCKQVCEGGAMC